MKEEKPSPYSTHDEVWLLLPWYANRSLQGAEHKLVRDHLGVCLQCRKELEMQSALARRFQHAYDPAISPQPSFERLISRIHAAENPAMPARRKPKLREWQTWRDWMSLRMRPGPWSFALAAAFLLAVVPLYWRALAPVAPHDYRTVANPGSLSGFTERDVRVVFADEVTEKQISALLASVHGNIVDGPTAAGVYTLRITDSEARGPSLSALLQELRTNPAVVFAEPALPPGPQPR